MSRSAQILLLSMVLIGWPRAPAADEPSAAAQLPEIEYFFEDVTIRGNADTRDRFFSNLLNLDPGERVSVQRLDRFRRQLMSTGFFSEVDTRLLEGSRPETVLVEVTVVERNSLIIEDVFFGISSYTPIWGGIALAETNLLGTGLRLGGGFVASGDQVGFVASLEDPFGALGIPLIWHVDGRYTNAEGTGPSLNDAGAPSTAGFDYTRIGGRAGLGVRLWSLLGIRLDYRIEGIDFGYTDRNTPKPLTGMPVGPSLLSNLILAVDLDTRDHREMPTRGHHAGLELEGSAPGLGSDYRYLRLTGEANSAFWLGGGHVLRLGLSGGALWTERGNAPYFDGFYIGDISDLVAPRDLDLQFTDRRTPDFLGNGADLVTYGDLYGLLTTEWAYVVNPVFNNSSRIEFFVSLGALGITQGPWAIGRPPEVVSDDAGESQDGFHVDLTGNLGLRAATPVGTFSATIGYVLGLAPLN